MAESRNYSLGAGLGFGMAGRGHLDAPSGPEGRDGKPSSRRSLSRSLRRAKKQLQRRWRLPALGCALGVLVLSWWIPVSPASGPRYLHAKYPIAPGTQCLPQYFGMASLGSPPSGALTDQRLDACSGNRLVRGMRPGEVLTWGHLEVNNLAKEVPRGRRAYGVKTPSLKYLKGDRVDVFLRPDSQAQFPQLLLERVRVLRSTNSARQTLLAVKPMELTLLENASRRGTLTLALRNPEDRSGTVEPKRRRARKVVPVWTEDP